MREQWTAREADSEAADYAREQRELETQPAFEHEELAAIYRSRGLSADLASRVAAELMAHDAIGAHARDELGITELSRARPLQAAVASAIAFAVGAALPVVLAAITPVSRLGVVVGGSTLVLLAGLGALAAQLGGASMGRGAVRVTFWGAVAMVCTALIGRIFGTVV